MKKKWFIAFIFFLIIYFSSWFGYFLQAPPQERIKSLTLEEQALTDSKNGQPTPEDVMSIYIKAYKEKDTETIASLFSDDWFKSKQITEKVYSEESLRYLKYLEKSRGKIVDWKLPRFKVYETFALTESIVKRENGSSQRSLFVIIKVDNGWRLSDFFTLK
ncbi:MAG: hypothetical protein KAS39_08815 [Actinomycetia bacterium]|nr:hypothetical protein [Actinomycetes bacterium]